jgi:hypothetical protein
LALDPDRTWEISCVKPLAVALTLDPDRTLTVVVEVRSDVREHLGEDLANERSTKILSLLGSSHRFSRRWLKRRRG